MLRGYRDDVTTTLQMAACTARLTEEAGETAYLGKEENQANQVPKPVNLERLEEQQLHLQVLTEKISLFWPSAKPFETIPCDPSDKHVTHSSSC